MIDVIIRVEGLDILPRMSREIEPATSRAFRAALPSVGLLMEAFIREFVPVDTGRLRSSIGHFDSAFMVKPNPDINADDAIWRIGRRFVTVGTRVHYAKITHRNLPWMEIAMRMMMDHLDGILDAVTDDISGEILGEQIRGGIRRAIGRILG